MTEETMLAVVGTPKGPNWTERNTVPVPEPAGADEALVAVRAFAVNRGELSLLAARDGGWRPGQDVAGEVVRAAEDGSGPPAGARVAGLSDSQGWAEYAVVPAHRLAELPAGVGFEQAAALPIAGTTALNLVREAGALLGRRVLITGAAGGVGGFAVQLAARAGARVTAVARAEHATRLEGYGAAEVVAETGEAAGSFDVVLESVGGVALTAAIERIVPGGTILSYGNSSREPAPFDFSAFFGHEDARVQTYFSYLHEARAGAGLAVLLELVAAGELHVELAATESWDRLDDVLDRLRDRRLAGKAVLTVG